MSLSHEVHLLVLVHGMWGSPANLAEMLRIIREKYASDHVHNGVSLEILVAQTNKEKSTYDGVDWGGERIAQEVRRCSSLGGVLSSPSCSIFTIIDAMMQVRTMVEKIEESGRRQVVRFSVVGYSLGGLLARYLIGYVLEIPNSRTDDTPLQ